VEERERGLVGKLKNSKSKTLSGKWIWPFQLEPFFWVRGTGPAHSAPACAPFSHFLFPALPVFLPIEPVCTLSLSILLHLILWISWTYACSIMCWQIPSFKDSKRGHQDASFKSDKQSKTSPSLCSIKSGEFMGQVGNMGAALIQGVEPPPRADSFPLAAS
jgi:hypothetical protein